MTTSDKDRRLDRALADLHRALDDYERAARQVRRALTAALEATDERR